MADATNSVAVHRCRFIDFDPSSITSLAFPPLPLPSIKRQKHFSKHLNFGTLAVGRANGNIDLCEWTGLKNESRSKQAWVIRKTLPGLYPSKVDSLAYIIREPHTIKDDQVPSVSDLRLFSSGGGSELLEWDIENSTVRRTINSQGGTIWCVAANPAGTFLALGCEDGTIRLISVADDTLTHSKHFDRVKGRILSVAWGPPVPKKAPSEDEENEDEDEWFDSWLVTGCSDSSLRKWDAATGRMLDRMGTDKIRGERTLVWAVAALGDGTIVSGDSLGMVKFWDSRTCTQVQSFKSHGADVLCLTVGPDGLATYSSGVDQKLVQYSRVKTSQSSETNSEVRSKTRWMQTSSRRMHAHDVRSLAVWPPYTPLPPSHKRQFPSEIAPVIASGGLDMSVVVTPAALPSSTLLSKVINPLATSVHATFDDSYHRRMAYSSGPSATSAIHIARQARLVSCMRDSSVSIWRILKKPSLLREDEDEVLEESDTADWEKCAEMELDVHTNLVASAISDDGAWLVVSDLYEAKLFRLIIDTEGRVKPRRIRDFSSIISPHLPQKPTSTGGLSFAFTPDSTKLVMSAALTSYILVIDISEEKPRVLRKFDHHRQRNNLSVDRVTKDLKTVNADVEMDSDDDEDDSSEEDTPLLGSVTRMAVSADGQWLATSDDHCRTHIFNLDSIQHHCVLPSFSHPAQSIAFSSSDSSLLVLAFPNNTFQIYDVETRQFPSWSRELCDNLPKRFTQIHDPIIGVAFEPPAPDAPSQSSARFALFWGSTWLCKINFDDGPIKSYGFSRKRRRESFKPQKNNHEGLEEPKELKMITQYRPVLFVDYMGPGELIVVERPLVDVLANLPPAYFRHKYGAS
ncbi:WD40-repeat-containing domain protein [Lentinula aff. detonsa]|nr:WD40-repeat-containing domain protein [Lentinula aff. detonsa]